MEVEPIVESKLPPVRSRLQIDNGIDVYFDAIMTYKTKG